MAGTTCLEVKLTTKVHGSEISWTLGTCSSDTSYGNNQEYVQRCCLAHGSHYLQCLDSYGDGWTGGYIEVAGTSYCDTFSSGRSMSTLINLQGTQKNNI